MDMLTLLGAVFLAGAVGGVVNALISDNGFVAPRYVESDESRILRPGFLGNVLIGGVSACVSWGLYGPLGAVSIIGGPADAGAGTAVGVTLAALVGAVLVGVGGARWLTNEVDKRLLKAAAAEAASRPASAETATRILASSPAHALKVASEAPGPAR